MMPIGNLIYPRRCPICDDILTGDELICPECITIPRKVTGPRCSKCSKHLFSSEEDLCEDCREKPKRFESGISLFEYDSVKESVQRFKNVGRCEYAKFYAGEICKNLGNDIKSFGADAIIPIPLHKSKLKDRGYNQSELLGELISKNTGIPIFRDVLFRTKKTKDQKTMSAQQRQNNLVGAFHMGQNDVKLDTVILIDDVYTTGSTMDEAAGVLKAGGINKVYFVTLAIGIGNT